MKLQIIDPFLETEKVKQIWEELCRYNDTSYFLSWAWVENWIVSLSDDVCIQCISFFNDSLPILAFFVGEAKADGYKILSKLSKSRILSLNTTGITKYDELTIEYNSILSSGHAEISLKTIVDSLPGTWNEFLMPRLEPSLNPGKLLKQSIHPYRLIIEKNDVSPFVDLDLVRRKNGEYLSLLSSNTRYQIKRSLRLYESRGSVKIEAAKNIQSALEILEELIQLNTNQWKARDKKGSFECNFFTNFHKSLVRKRFDSGEIQLLKITCGQTTIGCLYNFIYKGRVFFYQCGFNYERDNKLKPGLVSHLEAILLNAGLGYSVYDFLHKADQYKKSLATNETLMISAKIQKPSPILWAEEQLINFAKLAKKKMK